MKNKMKEITIWSITIILVIICIEITFLDYGNFSAVEAHKQSERTIYYGPSEIIKTIDIENKRLFLCRYKKWFSLDEVEKELIKWYPGTGVTGTEIKKNEKITFSWRISKSNIDESKEIIRCFGYVNDTNITKVILEKNGDSDPTKIEYDLDESRLFVFCWTDKKIDDKGIGKLKGLDASGKIICEYDL
ncbi:hypothetical protein [Crassaminicella profunda]|uniref:hypothetical protein n=1 Tax=Crassaminicella profunda TaxID=1286698 RepID=UPI001CA6B830|nr:hypothetical protein [Crassaminicella profunda]QZY54164.1 hypothetical protein K7H06_14060 [Crassaminicella profunda]